MLFTTKLSVMVLRPTWKVNVKRMASPPFGKWGQPPAVVCSACRQKRLLQNTTKYNKLQGINQARRERNVLAGLLYYRLKIKPYRLKFHMIPCSASIHTFLVPLRPSAYYSNGHSAKIMWTRQCLSVLT